VERLDVDTRSPDELMVEKMVKDALTVCELHGGRVYCRYKEPVQAYPDKLTGTSLSGQGYPDKVIRTRLSGQGYLDKVIRTRLSGQGYLDKVIWTRLSGQANSLSYM
jgi:hypothetical protein